MFLRGERFEADKAAHRLVKHFEYKKNLFGESKLTRPITYDDLNDNDRASLNAGFVQFLGEKDILGRTVGFIFPEKLEFAGRIMYVLS